MKESNQDPVGTQEQSEASGKPEKKQEDKVAYETYRKVLTEKKARDQQLSEMEQRLQEYEQRELERKGEFEGLISNLREENKNLKDKISQRDKAYIMSKVNNAIKTKAVEAGCKNPDKLLRLIEPERINSLEVDDQFNVDTKSVEYLVNEAKKENDFLFKQQRANVQDGNPVDRPVVSEDKKVKDMSIDEIKDLYKQLSKR